MPLVMPNEGLPGILANYIKDVPSGWVDWTMILFVNDIVPDQDTVYADLTQPGYGWYSGITIDHTLWTDPIIEDNRAVSTYTTTPQTYTMDAGSGYVYGYALVTSSSPVIKWVERFATPEPISAGRILNVLPRVTQTTEVFP